MCEQNSTGLLTLAFLNDNNDKPLLNVAKCVHGPNNHGPAWPISDLTLLGLLWVKLSPAFNEKYKCKKT